MKPADYTYTISRSGCFAELEPDGGTRWVATVTIRAWVPDDHFPGRKRKERSVEGTGTGTNPSNAYQDAIRRAFRNGVNQAPERPRGRREGRR